MSSRYKIPKYTLGPCTLAPQYRRGLMLARVARRKVDDLPGKSWTIEFDDGVYIDLHLRATGREAIPRSDAERIARGLPFPGRWPL